MEELADKLKEIPQITAVAPPPKQPQGPIVMPPHIKTLVNNGGHLVGRLEGPGVTCGNCNDAGVLVVKQLLSGPYDVTPPGKDPITVHKGKIYKVGEISMFKCPVCSGEGGEIIINSGLSQRELDLRYADFKPLPGKDEIRIAGNTMLYHYKNNGRLYGWITVWGGFGHGKSHWAKCFISELAAGGAKVRYMLASSLLTEIKDTFNPSVNYLVQDIINKYSDVKVLVLDELDKISNTQFNQEKIMEFLDGRYINGVEGKQHLTILIMNKRPDIAMQKYPEIGEYLYSRMSGGEIIEVGGADFRPLIGDDYKKTMFGEVRE